MNRRTTTVIAVTGVGLLAATAAVALGVPTAGTAVEVEEPLAVEATATAQTFYGTNVVLPVDYAAFTLAEDGTLTSVGDTSKLDQATLESVTAQLQAAPPQSVVYVDLDSLDADGLTTALATVTPTNGFPVGSTNEEIGEFLVSLFPGVQGTVASLDVADVPNASFSYTQTVDDITWQVTEYLFQYGDATVSVRMTTTDATGETRAELETMLAGMTR